jgi:hypothetical protein
MQGGEPYLLTLGRMQKNARMDVNAVAEVYAEAHARRLYWPGSTKAVRSPVLSSYDASAQQLVGLGQLSEVLTGDDFAMSPGAVCASPFTADRTGVALRLAARLLRHPGSVARHVVVGDSAFGEDVVMPDGYDFHVDYVKKAAVKLPYLWQRLIEIINEPGEGDPNKLDLDDTLIVINTEFGRAPDTQQVTGRNHYPYAYVTLMFGGPIGPDQQGIVGAIDASASPVNALRPAATRAAILCALGIYPFQPETFASSDISDSATEMEAALKLKEEVLGVFA